MAHLYVMSRSDAPGALKIGRSDDPERRAHELQGGHFFTMKVLARVEQAGCHEHSVHAALRHCRIEGPGVEWFQCSLGEALVAIGRVVGYDPDDDPMEEEIPCTALFREQQSHNECILKHFLKQVRSGEYPLVVEHVQGECTLSAREVYERLRAFSHDTGLYMNLDSSIAVGCALAHKYAALAPKVPGRVPKYRLQVGART